MKFFWGDLFDCRFYVADLLHNKKLDIILDIGCGVGVLSYISNAKLKVGLELQIESIKKAKKLNPDMQIIRGDIRFLPFRENFFHTILSIHSLSSLAKNDERIKALSEIKRVLSSKQGEIIITAANLRSNHYEKKFSLEERFGYVYYKELIDNLQKDFEIRIEGYNPYSRYVLAVLRRIVMKIPESVIIDKLVFRILKSKKFLKNGRSFVMICKTKNE